MNQLKKCALCGSDAELELSHIVPKMAVRTLKKTSVGNIRSSENPNMVVQDSEKHYMLCGNCEDLFSKEETYFANVLFHPYLKKERINFDYDSRLFYFLTSVSWRSLYLDLLDFVENNIVGIDALECLIDSERIMREYLLHKKCDIDKIENHIFFFDEISEISGKGDVDISKLRPHATFHRGISSYSFCYEKDGTYGTITNMMGVVILTFYRLGGKEKWENTKIINGNGNIQAKDQFITSVVGNEFTHIMKTAEAASHSMSQVQQQKIMERLKKAGELVKDSQVYQDWMSDERISNK